MQLYAGTDRRSEQGKGQDLEEETMAESLALYAMGSRSAMTSLKRLVEDYERRLILEALARARGNQRRAAAELGCLPTTLNEKMRRLGLRACDRPEPGGGNGVSQGGDHGTPELTGTA
jgi:DNA-binding NtrC family response regulator